MWLRSIHVSILTDAVGFAPCSSLDSRFIVRIISFRLLLMSVRYQPRPHCFLGMCMHILRVYLPLPKVYIVPTYYL